MNYYTYGDGGPMQPSDKAGMPGIYSSSLASMAYPQQAGLPPGAAAAAMQSSAQHYTSIGSAQAYPGGAVYASSNPYGSVSQVSTNPYVRQSALTSAHVPSAAAMAAQAYAGYSASPYAGQAVSPTFRGAMVAPTTRYPSTAYSVGNSGMLSYPGGGAPLRNPAAYQAMGGYPGGLPSGIAAYQSTAGAQGYAAQLHPGYASMPTYPGASPYSRQMP